MTQDQPPADSVSAPEPAGRGWRYLPCAVLFLLLSLIFIGGAAAVLYLLFSEFSGVRDIWLLACGAPVGVILLLVIAAFTLYTRYGRPLRQIFKAIDAVAAGDLAVRVPEDNSPQFGELIKRFNTMVGELERAEQQRRNLTADIAHELRTPLHVIQGNLEGVIDGVYQPTPEHLNNTLDETRLLTRLVNDLQTLSLAETGQLPLHPTRFSIADLITDLAASFSSQAASLGIDLQTDLADLELSITADYDRLNQVLSNLLSNALRYTPAGGTVLIRAEPIHRDSRNSPPAVRLMIRDTGSGIPAEDLPFIFDRFWRGDRSRSERTHSGLGLSIAKQLIQSHGGTIEAQSEGVPGKGTTFIIELPQSAIE